VKKEGVSVNNLDRGEAPLKPQKIGHSISNKNDRKFLYFSSMSDR
jgi:hypothetical protein